MVTEYTILTKLTSFDPKLIQRPGCEKSVKSLLKFRHITYGNLWHGFSGMNLRVKKFLTVRFGL